jgi:phage baseplate assembly protein W
MTDRNVGPDFVGSGWAFPVRVNGRGGIEFARGPQDIDESIRVILSTPIGERRMRPRFGCGVHDLVFAPNDAATHGLVRRRVLDALQLWEPRIVMGEDGVDVAVDPQQPDAMQIRIHYVVRSTNERRNLVYPFYLIPQET